MRTHRAVRPAYASRAADGAGIDVVAGILGMDPKGFGRRAQPKGPQVEREMVKAFLKRWAPHDWTAELDGGAYE